MTKEKIAEYVSTDGRFEWTLFNSKRAYIVIERITNRKRMTVQYEGHRIVGKDEDGRYQYLSAVESQVMMAGPFGIEHQVAVSDPTPEAAYDRALRIPERLAPGYRLNSYTPEFDAALKKQKRI